MRILETLGWKPRKARPVGHGLETSGRSGDAPEGYRGLVRVGLFLALCIVTVLAFPRGEIYEYAVQVGDTWRQPTLEAPFNFPIIKDEDRVRQERAEARANTPPYFEEMRGAQQQMRANRDTLAHQLDRIFEAYASFRYHRMRGQDTQARQDSLQYLSLRRKALVTLTPAQWEALAQEYVDRMPGLTETPSRSRAASGERLDQRLLRAAFEQGSQLLQLGVLNIPRDSVQTETIIVRNEAENAQRRVSKDNVYGLNEAYQFVQDEMREQYSDQPEQANIAFAMFRDIFQPSLRYMRAETIRERERRARNISTIRGGVEKGEVIVSKGEEVTPEIRRKLTSLARERNVRAPQQILWQQLSGEALFSVLVFAFLFAYLYLLRPDIWRENRQLLLVALMIGLIVVLYGVVVRLPWASLYGVPIALASVVLTVVFNSHLALFATLILAFIGGQMQGLDLEFAMGAFLAGALGIFSVRDIKNRGQFVISAVLVFVGYAAVLTASWLYLGSSVERFGREMMFAGIGASFTIVSTALLWAVERLFDVTTDLTLLELSDTNNKLLKDLSLQAPGSFNHSLQVANLAEAAADTIGAHALLTRVGALYHDIGKMQQPEYFVENQSAGSNPHDDIKPRMSALVIARHVKQGLEMAKEAGLPKRVQKFIPMHHGTARIEYFYRKAIEQTDAEAAPVLESEFRYPGPKPDSKETGILMLADSVEAASRSLDQPTHKRLQSLIDLIFKERIEDGQLDDTDLTFRDLRRIKETFLQMLMGIYHVRVKYPDQEEETADEEEVSTLVSSKTRARDEAISILYEQDVWGTPEQSISAERLRKLPGVHSPRAPRPELAQASPYRVDAVGDGVPPAPNTTSDAPPLDEPENTMSESASLSDVVDESTTLESLPDAPDAQDGEDSDAATSGDGPPAGGEKPRSD